MDDVDDQTLMRLVARRDPEALRQLYRRHAPHVHALARRMLHDPDEAKSVVQDTFVRVWDAAGRFDPELGSSTTWIIIIAHRLALRTLRDRAPAALALEDWDGPESRHVGSAEHLDEIFVGGAVSTLELADRSLIELAYYRGHSHSELAVITGWPLGTVKTRLRATLARLRARLETT